MDWIFVPSQKSYIEILKSKMMILDGGVLEMWLDHEARVLTNKINILIKETPER
jgi:hypothetical protein